MSYNENTHKHFTGRLSLLTDDDISRGSFQNHIRSLE